MNLNILNAGQNYFVRGGSDRYQFELTELLEQHGHTVIPFAAQNPKNRFHPLSGYFPSGVNFDDPQISDILQFIYSLPAKKAIEDLISMKSIDIAHLHIYYGQLTSSILSPLKSRGIPIVQTLHEYKIVCPVYTLLSHEKVCQDCSGGNFWNAVLKRCNRGSLNRSLLSAAESYISQYLGSINKVDHFIAVSDFLKRTVIDMGVPSSKVSTIHHSIDCSTITPNNQIGNYFLYFGRVERLKGIFTLIEAMAPLTNLKLLIVGDGEARNELERTLESRRLSHIHFLGFRDKDELDQLIYDSICTLIPSEWYEPFGLTLIESFARARPVIASRIGGIQEIVSNEIDGFLINPGDVEELREKILWMAYNKTAAIEMGVEGRKKVENCFSRQSHYRKLIEVYQSLI